MSHLSVAHRVAAGLHAEPTLHAAFNAAQAAWRFFANDSITLQGLAEPLLQAADEAIPTACRRYVLIPVDWCNLHLNTHASKEDRVELAHCSDLGYELLTALALSDHDGSPIAPLCLELRAADGVHSTRQNKPFPALSSLDGLNPVLGAVSQMPALTGKKPLFIIDREADSVKHFREWDRAAHRFLVRAKDAPRVLYKGVHQPLGQVAKALGPTMTQTRVVDFHGKPAKQFVAQAEVVLTRPGRSHRVNKRTGKARHKNQKGPPLTLRVVVSEVRDEKGKVLARWLLLTNLPAAGPDAVDAATIALWYYWRWRIESYHKLLKSAGQQIEYWQQETAAAFAKRLLVATMACVVVWKLARDERPQAVELRTALVGLSGRQMKRGKTAPKFTEPALLAGLELLTRMLLLLERHDINDLRHLVDAVLPGLLPSHPSRGAEDV